MSRLPTDIAALILRIVAGCIFIPHGWSKIAGEGGAAAFAADIAASYHIPAIFGHAAAWSELAGGMLLVVGLLTRLDALLLAATMFVATFIVQLPDALYEVQPGASKFFVAMRGIETPLALLAMCVAMLLLGPGRASLDHAIASAWRRRAAVQQQAARAV